MSSLTPSLVIAVWASNVQARNETLVHGWRSEPSGRGTWSILWSCLATIFICTWSALHLPVPNHYGRWHLLFRKLRYMLAAAVAPEYFLAASAANFFNAPNFVKFLIKKGNREWKLTHIQFARMDGFYTREPEGDTALCDIYRLWTLIETESIDGPPISEEELQARGKSDLVIKLIAVLQILWFVVQTLLRAIQHYQITALEILTVAVVFCSIVTYALCLNLPQDVVYPVILELRNVAPATDETTPERSPDQLVENAGPPNPRTKRVQSVLGPEYDSGAAKLLVYLLLGFFACGFGALHCLAWNSPFPTSKERLAWRICSVATTALPVPITLHMNALEEKIDNDGFERFLVMTLHATTLLYVLARTTIIVLAFTTLRALPADAFETVTWNNYLPHFAA